MGFFSDDMLPMLGVYQAETSESMGALDAIASRVEREKAFTHEDVAELFRHAHTVKGSSAMMGLDALARLTHKVEDLFDLLRGDPSLAEGRVADILDHLYSFCDYVNDEVARMEEPDYAPADAEGLIKTVSDYVASLGGDAAEDDETGNSDASESSLGGQGAASHATPALESEAPSETCSADEHELDEQTAQATSGTTLKVSFKPDVPMVNARALVIVRQLKGQVSVLSHVPENLSDASAAQAIAQDGLLLVVEPAQAEDAKQFLAKNSFISRIVVLDETLSANPTAADQKAESPETASTADKFISLRWDNVRELQNLAGEFLLHASHIKTLSRSELASDGLHDTSGLRTAVLQLTHLVDDLVYRVDRMAMVSMSAMVPQLSRMVRDMCRNSGKQVSFEVHGGGIEIDRNLYNSISDPLLHIIRNAVDHGIESPEERLAAGKEARGTVTLSIENLGARVAFRVSDDGRGIDTDKVLVKAEASGKLDKPASSYTRQEVLHMVMLAGLSTSSEVTQYSGRGVGMDVVNTVIRDFNGRVDIESEPGAGTSMTLFMPVSVTSVECLGFRIGCSTFHMPLRNLNKIFSAEEAAEYLSRFEGSTLFTFEKRELPVLDMHRLLDAQGKDTFYIVCHSLDDEFVIGVDDVLGHFSCANKPLPSCLGPRWQAACPIRNVAIMDDGTVGFVLNAALLADLAQGRTRLPDTTSGPVDEDGEGQLPDSPTIANVPEWAFVFALGSDWYALGVDHIERLNPLPACTVTPRGSTYLMGLANYRNQAVALFDLAKSAGAGDESRYALIIVDNRGEYCELAITSAVGVRDLSGAVMAEEQPEPRALTCGLYTTALLIDDPKEPPINVLARA